MNYKTAYDRMMLAAKKKNLADGITSLRKLYKANGEVHHIVPRKFGGKDTIDNLVLLSNEDHVYAHFLLNLALVQEHDFSKLQKLSYTNVPHSMYAMLKERKSALRQLKVNVFICGKKQPPNAMSIVDAAKFFCMLARQNYDNTLLLAGMTCEIMKLAMFSHSKFGYKLKIAV